jgi:hypothetical protein
MHIKAIIAILFGVAAFLLIRGMLRRPATPEKPEKRGRSDDGAPLLISDASASRDRPDADRDGPSDGDGGGDGGGGD